MENMIGTQKIYIMNRVGANLRGLKFNKYYELQFIYDP